VRQKRSIYIYKHPRGAARTAFGNPAHGLDAANFIKLAWDTITSTTIKMYSDRWRYFPQYYMKTYANELDQRFSNLILDLQSIDVHVTKQEIE